MRISLSLIHLGLMSTNKAADLAVLLQRSYNTLSHDIHLGDAKKERFKNEEIPIMESKELTRDCCLAVALIADFQQIKRRIYSSRADT